MEPRRTVRVRNPDLDLNDLTKPASFGRPPPAQPERPNSLASIMAASQPPPPAAEIGGPFVRTRPPLAREAEVRDSPDVEYYEDERSGRRRAADDAGREIYKRVKSHSPRSHRSSRSSSYSGSRERDRRRRAREQEDDRERDQEHGSRRSSREPKRNSDFRWDPLDALRSEPPSDLTVTHVNQTRDLLRLEDLKMAPQLNVNTAQWLDSYSLEKMQLTLKDLLAKGSVSKPVGDKTGKAVQQIKFEASVVDEFEYKLNLALEIYSKRIKWLMQSSRKVFGLVQGQRVAVLIDSSNANMSFGRAIELQDALMTLIDEQLSKKKQLYFLTFGSEPVELWDDMLKDVHHRSIEDAKLFVTHMKPSGGCNVLRGLRKALNVTDIETVLLVVGSVPDQNMEILCDYIYQSTLDKKINFHCVSYELSNHIVNSGFKKLAEETNGRYQCFSNSQEELVYNSTDINLLLKEIQKAQDILNKIKEMRKGTFGSALIQIQNEISNELEKYPQGKFMPKPRGHDMPLNIEKTSSSSSSKAASLDWIEQHSLKAQKLNIYQILAPNAYSYVENYVPILNKTVQSQVHERVMVQFEWHDQSIKNVHVDLATLYDFQKRLKSAVELYEKRIDWLSTGSRKIFGALNENSVVILIDLSYKNQNYLVHIQHSLRLLLEQQMPTKKCFNLIGFGRTIKRWKPTVVRPTAALLQDAWRWVLQLTCEGTHDVLGALRAALENDEERKHHIDVEGIYVFTSGMPDQSIEALCGYLEENACGRRLRCHTILFNVDDYDINGPIPGRWANIKKTAEALRTLAHCVPGGRFHWFRETGIIESDDIRLLQLEIEKAVGFSKKAAALVDKIKRKDSRQEEICDSDECCDDSKRLEDKKAAKSIMPPKPTALSLQRMALQDKSVSEMNDSLRMKSLPWRPNSSKTEFLPINQSKQSLNSSSSKSLTKSKSTIKTDTFYIGEDGNTKGMVVRTSSAPSKPYLRGVPTVSMSEKEENVTTKEWLKKYSLVKLKLDLNKLVAGPECKHETAAAASGSLKRYCTILPSVNVNGTVRHLQLKQHELKNYQEQCEKVLKRYVKRLQWLLSDSRRLFGTIVHKSCTILVDTSGSMSDYMSELKRELSCLVWEQLYKYRINFNFIGFSDTCEKWKDRVVEPTEENCHKVISWLSNLNAHGNTCTLDALKEAFDDDEIDSIYLITDGKPDTSTTLVLDEVQKMNSHRHLSINVISFNCDDKSANEFLSQLAAENNGRYHRSSKSDREIHLFVHKILTEGVHESFLSRIPDFEGDDLRRLTKEIDKAKTYLRQAVSYSMSFNEISNQDLSHASAKSLSDERHKSCLLPLDMEA